MAKVKFNNVKMIDNRMKEEETVLKGKSRKLKKKGVEEAPSDDENLAQMEFENTNCPKCGQKKVISWTEQTRASDEPPTRFYKCLNCGYTWREYS